MIRLLNLLGYQIEGLCMTTEYVAPKNIKANFYAPNGKNLIRKNVLILGKHNVSAIVYVH